MLEQSSNEDLLRAALSARDELLTHFPTFAVSASLYVGDSGHSSASVYVREHRNAEPEVVVSMAWSTQEVERDTAAWLAKRMPAQVTRDMLDPWARTWRPRP